MPFTRRHFLLSSAVAGTGVLWSSCSGNTASQDLTAAEPDYHDWAWVRSQFPLNPAYRHFASFYLVSHPRVVRDEIRQWAEALDDDPLHVVERHMFEEPENNLQFRVCEAAARYSGGLAEEYAIVPNTTTGLALIYHGLSLSTGDEILTTSHDHFAHHEAIRLATVRSGATWRKAALYDDSATAGHVEIIDRLRAAISPQTRVIGITWVHSSTGVKLPVRDIASMLRQVNQQRDPQHRIQLVVDGVHGYGVEDEDIPALGCDFFVAGTHKWLFAPRGTGIIWAHDEAWAVINPVVPTFSALEPYIAWLEGRPPAGPVRADWVTPGGFWDYEHQWAMTAAYEFHMSIGRRRIAERIHTLNGMLKEGLAGLSGVTLHTPADPALSSGIVCFEAEGLEPSIVVRKLLDHKIIASTTPYNPEYARLAAGLMNTEQEVREVVRALGSL